MNRPKDYIVKPHRHLKVLRKIKQTQEILFIRKGKIKIDLYTDKGKYISGHILNTGDIIFLASGCHGLKMLKKTEIIEVKQGPYSKRRDKTFLI
jgi:cupin fold WbuC family metalloprotein